MLMACINHRNNSQFSLSAFRFIEWPNGGAAGSLKALSDLPQPFNLISLPPGAFPR